MKNVPEKIYLQVDADGETPEDFTGLEITWCADRINENDIAYIREPSTEQSGGTTQEELWNELNRKFPDQDSIIYDLMHNWIITRKP